MAKGERFVQATLSGRARARKGQAVGLPALLLSLAGMTATKTIHLFPGKS